MISTTNDYQKLAIASSGSKRLYCHFRLSDIVAVSWVHLIRTRHGQKYLTCRWNFDAINCSSNCNDISHTVADISTPGFDGHTATSGCPSMAHLLVDTFFEFGVAEKCFSQ